MLHLKSSQWSTGKALVRKGGEKRAGCTSREVKTECCYISLHTQSPSEAGPAPGGCCACRAVAQWCWWCSWKRGAASTFYLHDAVLCVMLSPLPLDMDFTLLGSSDHVLPHHITWTHQCSPFVRKEQLLVTLCWHLNTCETVKYQDYKIHAADCRAVPKPVPVATTAKSESMWEGTQQAKLKLRTLRV